jgi:hypothetical protein
MTLAHVAGVPVEELVTMLPMGGLLLLVSLRLRPRSRRRDRLPRAV